MDNKKITPITRINKFFSEEDFGLEISMGREALEGDGNFTVILYLLFILFYLLVPLLLYSLVLFLSRKPYLVPIL